MTRATRALLFGLIALPPLACGGPTSESGAFDPPAIEQNAVGLDTLAAVGLEGPQPTLDDYCDAAPGRCTARPAGWSGTLAGRGAIDAVALIADEREVSDERRELICKMALRTSDGWFFEGDRATCGFVDVRDYTTITIEALEWVDDIGRELLIVEYRTETITVYPDSYDEATGTTYQFEPAVYESRFLRLCGVGDSGVPACTEEIVLQGFDEVRGDCPLVRWRLAQRRLELTVQSGETSVGIPPGSKGELSCPGADAYPRDLSIGFP
jgi:hypothetical protein